MIRKRSDRLQKNSDSDQGNGRTKLIDIKFIFAGSATIVHTIFIKLFCISISMHQLIMPVDLPG